MSAFSSDDSGLRATPTTITQDRPCVKCGYNLRGLSTGGKCPECGRAITRNRVRIFNDNLVNAPLAWIEFFSWGAFLCLAACVVAALFLPLLVALSASGATITVAIVSVGLATIALVWNAGVYIITRPRPVTATTAINPSLEWRLMRWASRLTQLLWFLAIGASFVITNMQSKGAIPSTGLHVLNALAFLIAVVGLIFVLIYASDLCFWAADSHLAFSMRTECWLIGWAVFIFAASAIETLITKSFGGGYFTAILSVVWTFSVAAPVIWGAACVWRFNSLARWAVINHVTADARDARLRNEARPALQREQAERDRKRREAAARPAPAPKSAPKPAPPPAPPGPKISDPPLNPYDVA